MLPALAVGLVASLVGSLFLLAGNVPFAQDACKRLEKTLVENVVGQEVATEQLIDAICPFLNRPETSEKPLVISVHGPPGVGKTLTHRLVAHALYGLDGSKESLGQIVRAGVIETVKFAGQLVEGVRGASIFLTEIKRRASYECPGKDCPGYKVVYGMDFLGDAEQEQVASFKRSILEHLQKHKEAILVIEEYDKLNCGSRAALRQLIQHPAAANVTMSRSIVFLESNLGTFSVNDMLNDVKGKKELISPEAVHTKLKDDIFSVWTMGKCEATVDTIKALNLVDYFLPFFPLGVEEIRKLIRLNLRQFAIEEGNEWGEVSWGAEVVEFLLSKIDFDNGYPVDGGKDVGIGLSRYVRRAIRKIDDDSRCIDKVHLTVDKKENTIVTQVSKGYTSRRCREKTGVATAHQDVQR